MGFATIYWTKWRYHATWRYHDTWCLLKAKQTHTHKIDSWKYLAYFIFDKKNGELINVDFGTKPITVQKE